MTSVWKMDDNSAHMKPCKLELELFLMVFVEIGLILFNSSMYLECVTFKMSLFGMACEKSLRE